MPSKYEVIKAKCESDPEYLERRREYARKYREKNRDKEKERQRLAKAKKREEDRDAYNAYMRDYNSKHTPSRQLRVKAKQDANPEYKERIDTRATLSEKEHQRHWKLKKQYGISLDDYNKMYENQKGKCLLCEAEKPKGGKGGLVIDHCHNKGHIRGLLCARCNTGLGQFRDDVSLLTKAIEYLRQGESYV